ncbi:MAG: hypothetical protein WB711_10035 [Terriglobales bacterium]
MRKTLAMSTVAMLILLMLLAAVSGAREKKKKETAETTIYGTIGCSVPAPPPPPPPVLPPGSPPPPPQPPAPADSIDLCLARKGKAVIVEDGTQTSTALENPEAVRDYEGHRVSISGYMNGELFHVVSLRII